MVWFLFYTFYSPYSNNVCCIYNKLGLEKNIYSYLSFTFFIVFFISYIQVYKYVINIENPLYIKDLPLFTYYKYIILTILGGMIVKFFFPNISHNHNIFTYINIKEEIRKIFYAWNDRFMGNICNYFYRNIAHSNIFSYIFFSIHFLLFFVIRGISLCLLINFVFFNGNLYAFAPIIPMLFFVWLLRFLDYYFTIFRLGTINYLNEILIVTYEGKNSKAILENQLLHCNSKDIKFALSSPMAEQEGFTIADLDFLKAKWYTCAQITSKFTIYNTFIQKITITFMVILYICWFAITIYFFNSNISETSMD